MGQHVKDSYELLRFAPSVFIWAPFIDITISSIEISIHELHDDCVSLGQSKESNHIYLYLSCILVE